VARTIHCAQGLTFDRLAFDLTSVIKHGLTYIPLSHICSKEHSYLLSPLTNKTFQVDTLVQEEMHRFRTTTQYELTLISLKSYCTKFVIIESLNTHSLTLHFQNILANQNLLTSHILCLNEMKIQNIHTNHKTYNVISQKFNILSCYDQHGTIMFYDNIMVLSQTTSTTNSSVQFITTSFNKNT
jgi:hypothetical protein